jgi:hypothetical protein
MISLAITLMKEVTIIQAIVFLFKTFPRNFQVASQLNFSLKIHENATTLARYSSHMGSALQELFEPHRKFIREDSWNISDRPVMTSSFVSQWGTQIGCASPARNSWGVKSIFSSTAVKATTLLFNDCLVKKKKKIFFL